MLFKLNALFLFEREVSAAESYDDDGYLEATTTLSNGADAGSVWARPVPGTDDVETLTFYESEDSDLGTPDQLFWVKRYQTPNLPSAATLEDLLRDFLGLESLSLAAEDPATATKRPNQVRQIDPGTFRIARGSDEAAGWLSAFELSSSLPDSPVFVEHWWIRGSSPPSPFVDDHGAPTVRLTNQHTAPSGTWKNIVQPDTDHQVLYVLMSKTPST